MSLGYGRSNLPLEFIKAHHSERLCNRIQENNMVFLQFMFAEGIRNAVIMRLLFGSEPKIWKLK